MKREQLISSLSNADDRKIGVFFEIWDDLTNNIDSKFTKDETMKLEKRREDLLSGKNTIFDWENMHAQIRNNRT